MKKKPRPPLRTSKRNKLVSSNDDCPAEEENFIAPSSSEIVLESALEVHHLTLPQRSQSLLTFLNEDRSRQKFCDLSVSVGGKIFQAHKVVLAHGSSYFHAELSKNPTTTQVTLDHVDDCVFQHLLSFLYASECLVTEKDLPALTEAARFLDMTELLKMLCGEAAVAQPQSLSQDQAEIQKSPETEMISTISPAGGQSPMEDIRQDIFENSTESSSGDHHRDAAQEDSLPEKVDTAGRKMPGRRRSSRTRRIPGKYQRADRKDTVSSPEENTKVLSSVVQDEARVEEAEEPAAENLMAREDVNPVAGEQRVDADVVEDEGGDIIEVVLSQEKIDEVCAAEKGSQDVESKKSEGDGVEKPEMCGRAAGNSVKSPTYPEGLAPVITYTSSRKTLKCPKCDKVFDRAGKYESHTRVHTGEKPFQCDICFQCYSTKSNLTVHKKKHTSDTPCQKKEHKCPFCNKLHASKKTLAKHVRRFHPDNIQEFFSPKKKKSEGWKCAACGKTFTRRPHLQEHMILHSQDRPFKCSYCDEHFKSRFARLKHHEKHHLGPFPCEICGRQFNDTGNRKRHIECTHGGKRKWTCFVCGKSVRERTTLREHMRIHSGEKPHLCSICGQSFRHGSSYRLHLRVHHDDKRYECDECGKTFIRHDHLTKHKKIHSGEKAHQCEECGKCFRRQDHLTVHYKSIHLGVKVWQKYKTAVHQCEVCKKEFKGKSSLEMHFRTHSGEKPHRCPECHQTFRIKKTLTKHMVIHSDARPFNCPHCSATFKRKDKLKYHVDHVHSNRITDQPAASHAEDKTVSVPFHENPKIYRTESKTALQSSPPPLNICVPVTLVPVQISGSAQGDINSPAGSSLSSPAQSVVNLQSQGQQQQNSAYQTTTELAFLEKYTLTPQPTNIIHPVRPDQMLDPREPSYLGTLLGLDSAPSVRNTD